MARGVIATAAAFALCVNLSASDNQHGNGSQHGQSTQHGNGASAHSTGTTSPSGTTTLSPVQQKVQSHTQLANKLQSRLPSGTNVVNAASGFRNLGQFVAAVNVSHNLGIPFTQLKRDMVQRHMSLGQSIQDLRPAANSTREIERAQTETRRMIGNDAR